MKRVIVFILILLIQPIELYHYEVIEWVDSCYGYDCLDRVEPTPPRKDWGWQSKYCKGYWSNSTNYTSKCNL